MRLTIHIGPHKTGTTSLQTAFAKAGRTLRRTGVVYPRCNWMYPAHHRLAFAMKDRRIPGTRDAPEMEVEIADLMAALTKSRCKQVVISSEEFFAAPIESIANLRAALGTIDVSILTFLRRPDSFLLSCYNQKLRQPGNKFHAPIRRFIAQPSQIAPEIKYNDCLSNWIEVFGVDAVHLNVYENGSPLGRTMIHLGLPPDLLSSEQKMNQSVPGAALEAMRHAKMNGMSAAKQKRLLHLATEAFKGEPGFQISNDERRSIIKTFEYENTSLFQRFGEENPFTEPAFQDVPAERDFNLTVSDTLRLIDTLL